MSTFYTHNYPDSDDTAVFGYRVEIHYDSGDSSIAPLVLPGLHETYFAARGRARKIAQAMRDAGETGCAGWVQAVGERPSGFPRNGVRA